MLDINFIRENSEKVKKGITAKQIDPSLVDELLVLHDKWTDELQAWQKLRHKRNEIAKAGRYSKIGRELKEKIKKAELENTKVYKKYQEIERQIPNFPADDVPEGKDESENVEVKKWGKIPKFTFKLRDHLELGELLDVIDIERGAKLSGTRFGYLKNEAVVLEFALVQLAFKTLIKEGFSSVIPPVLLNMDITKRLGYWDAGGNENYYLVYEPEIGGEKPYFYLAGTAEHSLVPLHKNEILAEKNLPRHYVGFSTCFRREAGTYGKDTRGIFRVHQFDKVEMVSFIKPQENADEKEHNYLLSLEEKLVQTLRIPYQITKMCTGDLGHPTARKYDVNCWFPTEGRYKETHSVSTCTDFQSRRLDIKYRDSKGKTDYVHILNGTAFAVGRTLIAILENYQQKDGSVLVPKVLQKYTGFKKISPKDR